VGTVVPDGGGLSDSLVFAVLRVHDPVIRSVALYVDDVERDSISVVDGWALLAWRATDASLPPPRTQVELRDDAGPVAMVDVPESQVEMPPADAVGCGPGPD
jgi:hypothetical protein